MISDSELLVLRDVVAQINQTAGYSYQVLVQGTAILGILYILASIIWIASSIVICKRIWGYAQEQKKKDSWSDAPVGAAMAGIALVLLLGFFLWQMANNSMMIANPQYVVIHDILRGAT